jgi:hypothetical protein
MAVVRRVHQLRRDSTNVARVQGLKDDVTDVYLTDAEATLTLATVTVDNTDPENPVTVETPVSGAEDIVLDFTAGTSPRRNEYRGTIAADVELDPDLTYLAIITAIAADGSQRVFREPCVVVDG